MKGFTYILFAMSGFNVYCGAGCKEKCNNYSDSLKGKGKGKKKPDESKIAEYKNFLFATLFHSDGDLNFVFYDEIKLEKLTDEEILKLIDKKESDNIYVPTIDVNSEPFKGKQEDEMIHPSERGYPHINFSKKAYEDDNGKYNFLCNGRLDSSAYGKIVFYVEDDYLYIWNNNIEEKIGLKGNKISRFNYVEEATGASKATGNDEDYEIIKYINNNEILKDSKGPLAIVEGVGGKSKDLVIVKFKKEKNS